MRDRICRLSRCHANLPDIASPPSRLFAECVQGGQTPDVRFQEPERGKETRRRSRFYEVLCCGSYCIRRLCTVRSLTVTWESFARVKTISYHSELSQPSAATEDSGSPSWRKDRLCAKKMNVEWTI